MRVHELGAVLILLLAAAGPAHGSTEATGSSGTDTADDQPDSILVVGQRPEYGVQSTSSATRTDTDIRNIPQALTVISESQIDDQDLRSIADLLWFVPGATPGTGESNRDQISLRGQNTTADFFVNGVRDDVQYFRDLYNVDRVEVLRGPNAMIFGRGGGGGVVNRVMKRSSLGTYRDLALSGDGFGGTRFTADVDQPLREHLGLRVNGMYENGDSFRRHVDLKRYGINPTLALISEPGTRADLSYEFLHDRRTTDRGLPSRGGEPVEGFDRAFFGDPDKSFAIADVHLANLAVEHGFGDVTVRNRTLVGSYDKFYQNIYPASSVAPGGTVALGAYNSRNDRTNLFNQTDVIWDNRLAGIDQTLLFGVELGRQKSRNRRLSGTIAGGNLVSLDDPTVDVDVVFAPSASDADNRIQASVAALYVQDQLRLSPLIEIVAGLRFDRFALNVDDLRAGGAEFSRTDQLWSPRLGLIFKPKANLSLYGSYSRSYLPQSGDQFSSLTLDSEALKPERFDNYEIGAKWEPVPGLLATAAVYQLDRTNSRATDPNDPAHIVLTGAQRSRGAEIGLERSVSDRWQVSAGYAWQDSEIRETTTAAPAGRKIPLVPRHSLSLWNRYDVSKTVGLGLGLLARSSTYASISNQVSLPAYARVDGAIFYRLGANVEVQVNVENLLGADYFPTAHNDNNIAPGAPRSVKATLRSSF